MGISISWFAVASRSPKETLETLGLVDTCAVVDHSDCEIAGVVLPNGSYLIMLDEFWHPMIHPASMEAVSKGGLVVGCSEYENVNSSLAFLYRDGKPVWHVSHVLSEGVGHLQIDGAAPPATAELLAQARKQGEEQGYDAVFSVPAKLAHETCGFRHEEARGLRFTKLERSKDAKAPPTELSAAAIADSALACLTRTLAPLGYERPKAAGEDAALVKSTPEDEIKVYFIGTKLSPTVCLCEVTFSIRNHYVQSFAAVTPGIEPMSTAELVLSELMRIPQHLSSANYLAKFTEEIESKLPALASRFHSIKELDKLVNNGKPREDLLGRPTKSHFNIRTGFSRLILAYLAGNRSFKRMVTQTDAASYGGANPDSVVNQLAKHLREHVKPLP